MTEPVLAELAQRWGVQTGYWDVSGQWHDAAPDSLVAVLAQLGAPMDTAADASAAVAEHQRSLVTHPVEPVAVAPSGEPVAFELRLPARSSGVVAVSITCEDGSTARDEITLAAVDPHSRWDIDGSQWDIRWVITSVRLPVGYHQATIEYGELCSTIDVLVPPARLPTLDGDPAWGVFAPTYGFVPDGAPGLDHLGIGHLGHLDELAARLAPMGARVVSTLPLLATYLDQPFEPSPYSPVSRRWWSELHLQPSRLPGLDECPSARQLLASRRVEAAAADLAARPLIDHSGAGRLMREVLDAMVADLAGADGPTAQAMLRFEAEFPELDRYAHFRALVERHGNEWSEVRSDWLGREIGPADVDPAAVARHRYIQFAAETQMAALADQFRERDQLLALDLPLGANPDGFDVWANPDDYAFGTATGAPPDDFFAGGQNWGFPPLHPITSRARGHDELRRSVRHHMRHSGLLRIDHLMGLERLWWIPPGHPATEGVYVRYPTNELMAVIAIEAQRAGAVVVGENLGTVSEDINETMDRWGMLGMYELQFEVWRARDQGHVRSPSTLTVAGLNTHDMPTLAGWWAGHDIIDSVDLGLVAPGEAPDRIADRRSQIEAFAEVLARDLGTDVAVEPAAVLSAALEWLGGTPAQIVLATLEDLWLEERPQNVPGTSDERPNWRRRFAKSIDEALSDTDALAVFVALQRARNTAAKETS